MNKLILPLLAAGALLGTVLCGAATAGEVQPRLYKYAEPSDDAQWPQLIFESKGKTYFKLAKGKPVPAVVAMSNCGTELSVQTKQIEGYLVVSSVNLSYKLTVGQSKRMAVYDGPFSFDSVQAPSAFMKCEPGSPAGQAPSARAGVLKVPVAPPVISKPPHTVLLTDGTVWGTVQRWSKEAKWQLSWEATQDFEVKLEATYDPDFEAALGQLMESLKRSQYPLRACMFDNKVVRVVHTSKSCDE